MEQAQKVLTRDIRHGAELLLPELGHREGLRLHLLALGRHPLLVGVRHHLREVVRVDSVQHVEKVVTWWALAFRVLVREELHHLRVLLEHREDGLDAELLVLRHLDVGDLGLLEQVLFAGEDCLEEVFVDRGLVRQVVLQAIEG